MTEEKTTVGKYLVSRLEEIGVKHVFGVPGDYVLSFFQCMENSNLQVIGTCNELNAGYAADAYSRLNGVSCACVTYGVGGFSMFNAVVGACAERLPLIAISGGPKLSERTNPHLLHHTTGDMNLQYRIYEEVTVASVILASPEQAPRQIDETIAACLRARRPVYIEIPVDIVSQPCNAPGPLNIDTSIHSESDILEEAVNEAIAILEKASNPVILAGIEIHRLGLRKQLQELVDKTGFPFSATLLGKSVIPEQHPQFLGVYSGKFVRDSVRLAVEKADAILCLGTLMTDLNLGVGTAHLEPSKMITANSDSVKIKHHVYNQVSLEDFLEALQAKLKPGKTDMSEFEHPYDILEKDFTAIPDRAISHKRFYERLNRFINKDCIVIAATGDSILSASDLYLPDDITYIAQAFYVSIGFAVPAALGAKLAAPDKRPVVFVGDGAFQMTAQAVSTIARNNLNPIFFLMNNDGYTIERVIHDGPFNDLHMWNYHKLPEVFNGGWGCKVKTEGELENALQKALDSPDSMAFIEVRLDRMDCSENLKRLGQALR